MNKIRETFSVQYIYTIYMHVLPSSGWAVAFSRVNPPTAYIWKISLNIVFINYYLISNRWHLGPPLTHFHEISWLGASFAQWIIWFFNSANEPKLPHLVLYSIHSWFVFCVFLIIEMNVCFMKIVLYPRTKISIHSWFLFCVIFLSI